MTDAVHGRVLSNSAVVVGAELRGAAVRGLTLRSAPRAYDPAELSGEISRRSRARLNPYVNPTDPRWTARRSLALIVGASLLLWTLIGGCALLL